MLYHVAKQPRAARYHKKGKYDDKECTAGFHVYEYGSRFGDQCNCGVQSLDARVRGVFIKTRRQQ